MSSFLLDIISEILHALPNYPKEAIDDFLAIKPTTIHVIDTNLGAHISKIELIEGTIIADWISTSVALINAGIPVEDYGSYTFGVFKALDALISKRLLEDLSYEMTDCYWTNLKSDLANYKIYDAEVYFDFLYRNGIRNRFFKSQLSGNNLLANTLKRCVVPNDCLIVANVFLKQNKDALENSTLSNIQKEIFLNK